MGKHRSYTNDLKLLVVKKYLNGESAAILAKNYNIESPNRIYVWVKKYESGDTEFSDGRGKARTGRPKKYKSFNEMSDKEYIEYLEAENAALKRIAQRVKQKKSMKK